MHEGLWSLHRASCCCHEAGKCQTWLIPIPPLTNMFCQCIIILKATFKCWEASWFLIRLSQNLWFSQASLAHAAAASNMCTWDQFFHSEKDKVHSFLPSDKLKEKGTWSHVPATPNPCGSVSHLHSRDPAVLYWHPKPEIEAQDTPRGGEWKNPWISEPSENVW